MSTLVRNTISLHTLPEHEQKRLLCRMYRVARQSFTGMDQKIFRQYFTHPDITAFHVHTLEDQQRSLVGFMVVRLFKLSLKRKTITLFSICAATLPTYRGRSKVSFRAYLDFIRYKLKHPTEKVYWFGMIQNPGVYQQMVQHTAILYPKPAQPIPDKIQQMMVEIANYFKLEHPVNSTSLSRRVGFGTRASPQKVKKWYSIPHPAVRFFVTQNPAFHIDGGLVTLVPISWKNIVLSAVRFIPAYQKKLLSVSRSTQQAIFKKLSR